LFFSPIKTQIYDIEEVYEGWRRLMGTHFPLTGFSTQQVAPHEINIIARVSDSALTRLRQRAGINSTLIFSAREPPTYFQWNTGFNLAKR
jgi:hypothetical protein